LDFEKILYCESHLPELAFQLFLQQTVAAAQRTLKAAFFAVQVETVVPGSLSADQWRRDRARLATVDLSVCPQSDEGRRNFVLQSSQRAKRLTYENKVEVPAKLDRNNAEWLKFYEKGRVSTYAKTWEDWRTWTIAASETFASDTRNLLQSIAQTVQEALAMLDRIRSFGTEAVRQTTTTTTRAIDLRQVRWDLVERLVPPEIKVGGVMSEELGPVLVCQYLQHLSRPQDCRALVPDPETFPVIKAVLERAAAVYQEAMTIVDTRHTTAMVTFQAHLNLEEMEAEMQAYRETQEKFSALLLKSLPHATCYLAAVDQFYLAQFAEILVQNTRIYCPDISPNLLQNEDDQG